MQHNYTNIIRLFANIKGLPDNINNKHIRINMLGLDNSSIQYKIKPHTPLEKLITKYCEFMGLEKKHYGSVLMDKLSIPTIHQEVWI